MFKATISVEVDGRKPENASGFVINPSRQICLHEVESETADSLIQKINNVLGASLDVR